ncbi:MAG TPA: UDP-glucose 4-epimerase GalE [Kofleriaceae bacterium]
MTVLVVGGAGYVGSHAVRALAAAGTRVVVLDDLSTGHRKLVPAGVPLHVGRLEDRDRLVELLVGERVRAVVHCAACSLVAESETNPRKYFERNCGGVLALTGAMLDAGVTDLVLSSSAAVYGEADVAVLDESQPRRPSSVYGVTKAFAEDVLTAYRAHGLRSVALRYFNAAGADPSGEIGEDHRHETHLLPIVLDAVLGFREAVTVFGIDYPTRDGTCLRDYVHVSDLADAHLRAIDHLRGGGASMQLDLGSTTGTTVREVIAAVEAVTGQRVPVRDGARRPGDPARLVTSAQRAEQVLGWRARRPDIHTIVEDAWRWHRRLRAA